MGTKNGWLVVFRPTPLKNHGVKVSWDDDIPFPTFHGKSVKIPWFQSPPTKYGIDMIDMDFEETIGKI